MRTGGPLPPERVGSRKPDPNIEPIAIDASCRTAADCTVKNVGNCCGYFPACVHKDSGTFPEQVKLQCEKTGTRGICGFREISGCRCVEGRCAASDGVR